MKKIYIFSVLILIGFLFSQSIPLLGGKTYEIASVLIKTCSMVFLSYIAIHIGMEFFLEKEKLRTYAWDGFVAFTTATIPWLLCALYIIFGMQHNPMHAKSDIVTEGLIIARFAAPTSVAILLSLLTAAGLGGSWMYRKARTLAIFDDLDTIILMIPLKKVLFYGFEWDIALFLFILLIMIFIAWKKIGAFALPLNWKWMLFYSTLITLGCELLYVLTDAFHGITSLSLEVLFPAFLLGVVLRPPAGDPDQTLIFFKRPEERRARLIILSLFMFFAGASMPPVLGFERVTLPLQIEEIAEVYVPLIKNALNIKAILWHVFILTILSNIGKLYPMFCYRSEATLRERIALAIGMCPRGVIGVGILVVSLKMLTVIEEEVVIVAMLTLALNLLLSGPFVIVIESLLKNKPAPHNFDSRSEG